MVVEQLETALRLFKKCRNIFLWLLRREQRKKSLGRLAGSKA